VKHWQCVQSEICRAEIDPRGDLAPVGEQIGMGQGHALWCALRTGGEQHRRGIACRDTQAAMQCPGKMTPDRAVELVGEAELGTHILEPDEFQLTGQSLGERTELGELDKTARGDDTAQPGGPARGQHAVHAGRVIEHGRNPPSRLQCKEGDRGANRVRQHQPDGLAGPCSTDEPASEH
jgi:hypothetical protein